MNAEQKILSEIERRQVQMYPRWIFYVMDFGKCAMAIVLFVVASLLLTVTLALVMHFASEISLMNFPYALVVLTLLTVLLACLAFVSSFAFYRIRFTRGAIIAFAGVIFFGGILFEIGFAEKLEKKMQRSATYNYLVPQSMMKQDVYEDDDDEHINANADNNEKIRNIIK